MSERKGECGCLDLYCDLDLDLRRDSYARKSVYIVVQKSSYSFHELKHSTAYMLSVNTDGKKSMGQSN